MSRRTDRAAAGFRLLVEPTLPGDSELRVLAVATARCVLTRTLDGAPRVLDADATGEEAGLWLERVEREQRPALVMYAPPGQDLRINGQPAAPVVPLAIGDVLEWDGTSLHVSWERVPQIAPPPRHLLGTPCPLCRVPVDENALVIVHECGAPLHLRADGEALECAVGTCAQCDRPVSLEAGLTYHPDPTLHASIG